MRKGPGTGKTDGEKLLNLKKMGKVVNKEKTRRWKGGREGEKACVQGRMGR